MKNKILKITSLFMSLIMFVSANTAMTATAYAASKPSATTITSLKAGIEDVTVKWKKKSSITGYQIQYSTNSKFKKSKKTVKVKKAKAVSKKIAGLKANKKYYVRVRTYKGKKYSKWSKVKSVTTKKHTSGYKLGRYTDEDYDKGYNDARNQAKAVIATLGITSNMSDLEKVARVQNWINNNWFYANDYFTNSDYYDKILNQKSDEGISIQDYNNMFYYKRGVCGDFANAFIPFMDELSIPCEYVSRWIEYGAASDHAWNIIKVDGYWWHYDCESFSEKSTSPYNRYKDTQDKSFRFVFYDTDNSSSETKELWQNCQPHGEDISNHSVYDKKQEFYSIISALN